MKVRVQQSAIAGEVAALSGSVLSSSAMQGGLPGIRLRAEGQTLVLEAYNARDHAELTVAAEVEVEGSIVVAADKAFPALIASLTGQDLVLEGDRGGSTLRIEAKGSEYSVPTLVAGDWPAFPDGDEHSALCSVEPQALLLGIQRASKAAAANETRRPIFEGLLLDISGDGVVLSATDSRRISVRRVPARGVSGEAACVVHARSLGVLGKMSRLLTAGGDVSVTIDGSRRVSFEQPGRLRLSMAVMGDASKFPNLSNVVPKEYAVDLVFDRRELLAAHKRASLFVGDAYTNPLVLAISDLGVLEIAADKSSATVGTARETLAAVETLKFEPDESYHIALNTRFLADGLGLVDGDGVRLRCTAGNTQIAMITEAESDPERDREFYLAVAVRVG